MDTKSPELFLELCTGLKEDKKAGGYFSPIVMIIVVHREIRKNPAVIFAGWNSVKRLVKVAFSLNFTGLEESQAAPTCMRKCACGTCTFVVSCPTIVFCATFPTFGFVAFCDLWGNDTGICLSADLI